VVLVTTVFAHPTRDFVTVFLDTNGGGLTDDFSGWVITNRDATGGQTFTLPAAAVGRHFIFSLSAAQYIEVDPQNEDQIIGLTDAAGNKIRSDTTIGTTVELIAIDSSKWLPIRKIGSWSDMD
jgi:hypothetical protein